MAAPLLQYLNFKIRVAHNNAIFNLNPHEIKLLDLAAKFHFSDQTMLVRHLIYQVNIASSITLHNCLKKLIEKGLLCAKHDDADGRVKKLALTELALEHYKQMDKAVMCAQTSKTVQLKNSLKR